MFGRIFIHTSSSFLTAASAETLAQVEEKRVVRKRAQLRIQGVLDQCLEALIGLNYVTEYQREDPMAECRYHCQLCDFRFSPKTFISHVTSVRHRKNFIVSAAFHLC